MTDRDLAKREREKTLNSLEAFIFETQVSKRGSLHFQLFQFICPLSEERKLSVQLRRNNSSQKLTILLFFLQDKLYQEEYLLVVSEEEKEQISTKLSEVSEWMDEDGYTATTKQLREKLSQLKSLCKDMFFRVEERRKWPDRVAALSSMLNTSSFFLR